jgi:formiminotetrahydrofolate cyclodeaminase
LLEKLVGSGRLARRLARIRHESLGLARQDAKAFARVIAASRSGNRRAFHQTLKAATEIPCRVAQHARTIREIARAASGSIRPPYRADVTTARAMAEAATAGAQALIGTNLAWLQDRTYAKGIRRRLSHGR